MDSRKSWPFALLLVTGLCVLVAKLALAPLYPRYTAAECRDAYARARSVADTHRVDLHPYDPAHRAVNHRCAEVRGARLNGLPDELTPRADSTNAYRIADTLSAVTIAPQPKEPVR